MTSTTAHGEPMSERRVLKVVQALIDGFGIDVNQPTCGWYPLVVASDNNNIPLAEWFVEHVGADVNVRVTRERHAFDDVPEDFVGTALDFARFRGHTAMEQFLLAKGATAGAGVDQGQ